MMTMDNKTRLFLVVEIEMVYDDIASVKYICIGDDGCLLVRDANSDAFANDDVFAKMECI